MKTAHPASRFRHGHHHDISHHTVHLRGFCRAVALAGAGLCLPALTALAACQITSVSDVSFGTYDVFATAPNTSGVGGLAIRCKAADSALVQLGNGQSHSYAPRTLRNGTHVLAYNLYTSPARNTIWGDGSGGTSVMRVGKNQTEYLSIFGSIPPGQDAAVGLYTDHIVISICF